MILCALSVVTFFIASRGISHLYALGVGMLAIRRKKT